MEFFMLTMGYMICVYINKPAIESWEYDCSVDRNEKFEQVFGYDPEGLIKWRR
jgi:hypothetical protein